MRRRATKKIVLGLGSVLAVAACGISLDEPLGGTVDGDGGARTDSGGSGSSGAASSSGDISSSSGGSTSGDVSSSSSGDVSSSSSSSGDVSSSSSSGGSSSGGPTRVCYDASQMRAVRNCVGSGGGAGQSCAGVETTLTAGKDANADGAAWFDVSNLGIGADTPFTVTAQIAITRDFQGNNAGPGNGVAVTLLRRRADAVTLPPPERSDPLWGGGLGIAKLANFEGRSFFVRTRRDGNDPTGIFRLGKSRIPSNANGGLLDGWGGPNTGSFQPSSDVSATFLLTRTGSRVDATLNSNVAGAAEQTTNETNAAGNVDYIVVSATTSRATTDDSETGPRTSKQGLTSIELCVGAE